MLLLVFDASVKTAGGLTKMKRVSWWSVDDDVFVDDDDDDSE